MKSIFLIIACLSVTSSIYSCENSKTAAANNKTETMSTADSNTKALYQYQWFAIELKGSPVPAEVKAWLVFTAGETKRVSGSTGCNSTTGSFELSGTDVLAFKQMATTRRACIGNADEVERNFMELLAEANKWKITGNQLILSNGKNVLAKFKGVKPPAEGQKN
jgi:heat shock protein HslJ